MIVPVAGREAAATRRHDRRKDGETHRDDQHQRAAADEGDRVEPHPRVDLRPTSETAGKQRRQCGRQHDRSDRAGERDGQQDESPPADDGRSGRSDRCKCRCRGSVAADVARQRLGDDEYRRDRRDQGCDPEGADLQCHGSIHAGSHGAIDLLNGEGVVADHRRERCSDGVGIGSLGARSRTNSRSGRSDRCNGRGMQV